MTVLNVVMDALYSDCDKLHRSGFHGSKNTAETVQSMANDLLQGNVFQCIIFLEERATSRSKNLKATFLTLTTEIFFLGK